jgi:glycosyltransferase involved in cell wall biosynthesis
MYEFSRIPPEWVEPLNSAVYDEIWVPCRAVADAFVASGVNATKIEIVPEPIDVETFDPDRVVPLTFPVHHASRSAIEPRPDDEVAGSFKFCSVFKFEERKGWRALLEAYYTTFTREDRVSLMVVGYLTGELPKGAHGPTDTEAIRLVLEFEAAKHGKIHRNRLPHVEVLTSRLSDNDMAQLYRACDAFVLPTLGEGWGLPVMQAMAMRLPTITTNTSGISAFTTADTVIYVKHTERPVPARSRKTYNLPKGATWSKPNATHLGELLRQMRSMPASERALLGQRAMEHVRTEFSESSVGLEIAGRVVGIERTVRERWAKEGRPTSKPGAHGEGSRLEDRESKLERLRPTVLDASDADG